MNEPLPFECETKEATHARFANAFTPDYYQDKVMQGEQPSAGTLRKHVFDLYCGVRMVVSIDVDSEGERTVHFSFGLPPDSPLPPTRLPRIAIELIKEFWHHPNTLNTEMTSRAYHVWCVPD